MRIPRIYVVVRSMMNSRVIIKQTNVEDDNTVEHTADGFRDIAARTFSLRGSTVRKDQQK